MQDIIVSINKNLLRISTVDKEAVLKTASIEIPKEVVEETRVINTSGLAEIIDNLIPQITSLNKNKLSLNFIMEPEDVLLRYVTVSKNGSDVGEQVISEIKEKNSGIDLDKLHFSYKKIAPFVYQFFAVSKVVMENYLEVSNSVGVGLKSIIPWVLALPKYENINDPAIFVCKVDTNQVIALSELNGVFFAGTYQKEKNSEELENLVKDLSFYKRSTPIKYIYTLNCDSFEMSGYETKVIETPDFNSPEKVPEGFELNTIVNFILDSDPEILSSQINALNLLPVPMVESKTSAMVIAGSVVGALLLLVGAYFGITSIGNKGPSDETQMAQDTTQNVVQEETQVLSETTEQTEETENDPNLEVKKGNLKIRVENGAGVSGLAARTKEFLEGFGYTVLTIDTADSKVEKTILNFKPEVIGDYENLVTEDMKSSFPDIEIRQDLPEDSDYDLLIIAGTTSEL
jgi:hypothetical protein